MSTNAPISAVERTWVPPHSSRETSGISTTRTCSPYFSPNSIIAPSSRAWSCVVTKMCSGWFATTCSFTIPLDLGELLGASAAPPWRKSKRSLSGPTYEPAWVTWSPSTLAQGGVQQVGGGVVGHRRPARLAVDVGAHPLAVVQLAVLEPGDDHLVVVDAHHVLDGGAGRVGLDPAGVGHLAAAAG